jgi:hypothetical protein
LLPTESRTREFIAWPRRFVDPIGLRGDVFARWDGATLALKRQDSPNAFYIKAETLEAALHAARTEEQLSELFLGPPNKEYSQRSVIELLPPNSINLKGFEENVPESGERVYIVNKAGPVPGPA